MKQLAAAAIALLVFTAGLQGLEDTSKPFSFGVDSVSDVFSIRTFNGSFNDDNDANKGETGNPGPPLPPIPYPYQGASEIRFFQPPFSGRALDLWVKFDFESDNFGALLKLSAYGTGRNDIHLSEWNGWFSLGPWFNDNLSFRLLAGNVGQNGNTAQYALSDSPLLYVKNPMGALIPVDTMSSRDHRRNVQFLTETNFPYGYWRPGVPTGYAVFHVIDTVNIFSPAGNVIDQSVNILEQYEAGLLLDINTMPLTFTVALGNLMQSLSRPFSSYLESFWSQNQSGKYDPEEEILLLDRNLSIGFRAESARIADMIMLSAVYKFKEIGMTKKNSPVPNPFFHTIDTKGQTHEFGVYVNAEQIPAVPDLGITLGYSGLFEKWDTKITTDFRSGSSQGSAAERETLWYAQWTEAELPFYHAVDLRLNYTGIQDLDLTLNNNVTFSTVQGFNENLFQYNTDPDYQTGDMYRPAWVYENWLVDNEARSESFFGLHNVFGAQYRISETLLADLQLANQLGIFTLKQDGSDVASATVNRLEAFAGINVYFAYEQHFRAKISGGLLAALNIYSYQDPETAIKSSAGYMDFAVPLGIHISY